MALTNVAKKCFNGRSFLLQRGRVPRDGQDNGMFRRIDALHNSVQAVPGALELPDAFDVSNVSLALLLFSSLLFSRGHRFLSLFIRHIRLALVHRGGQKARDNNGA